MNSFKKGDILRGRKKSFREAYHPIIFIGGTDEIPVVVILTHSGSFPCNIKMQLNHFETSSYEESSYFVAHKIEKMVDWGPYEKVGRLTKEGISFIESNLPDSSPITWSEYEMRKENGCPEHM